MQLLEMVKVDYAIRDCRYVAKQSDRFLNCNSPISPIHHSYQVRVIADKLPIGKISGKQSNTLHRHEGEAWIAGTWGGEGGGGLLA